jgi:teichuronic acid biosynthesis glycosyltransferase TuaG
MPNRVQKLIEFSQKSDVDIIHTAIIEFNRESGLMRKGGRALGSTLFKNFLIRNPIAHSSVMFKVSKIIELGGYSNVRFAEDYYLWLKALSVDYSFGYIDEALVVYDFTNILRKRSSLNLLQSELNILLLKLRIKPLFFIFSFLSLFLRYLFLVSPKSIKSLVYKSGELIDESQKQYYLKLDGNSFVQSMKNLQERMIVSVIIPHHNRTNSLRDAVNSIRKQTYEGRVEIVIVDDNSEEVVRNQLKNFKDKDTKVIFTDRNSGGPAKPRNIGIAESSGHVIAFLDSDDTWREDHLQSALPFVLTGIPYANTSYKFLTKKLKTFNSLIIRNQIITSSVVVPRNLILKTNLFPHSQNHSVYEDYVAWLKVSYQRNFATQINKTVNYNSNSSDSYRKKYLDDLTCVRSSFLLIRIWLAETNQYLSFFSLILMKLRITSIATIKLFR